MSSTNSLSILLFGATGYLGGSILVGLLKEFPTANITVVARSDAHDAAIRATGAQNILHADHSNSEAIKTAASKADVVINAADADAVDMINAVLAGLAERKKSTGKKGVYLHTSGTWYAFDKAEGVFDPSSKYYNDANEEDIKSIPADAIHRKTDELVFAADKAGDVSGYIVAPGAIFGEGSGPVKRLSVMFMLWAGLGATFKKPIIIGDGSNIANSVHIDDLVDLYIIVLKRALAGTDGAGVSPYAKFYNGVSGEIVEREIMTRVAKTLFKTDKLEQISFGEASQAFPMTFAVARNTLAKSDRGKAIGWTPKHLEPITEGIETGLLTAASMMGWKV
ncbi:NAD(P)-binding protein [Exidia glandulosa HHB12029]|uniref:NAD(P)-binding protein n=1 Tax=Exidia glandulosa HHB12029 TaxID=1314781 RepID=A0A165ZL92_EXIGL|nr:NAD(P)-binding protein [Exidia glandulosa HHB12029]